MSTLAQYYTEADGVVYPLIAIAARLLSGCSASGARPVRSGTGRACHAGCRPSRGLLVDAVGGALDATIDVGGKAVHATGSLSADEHEANSIG